MQSQKNIDLLRKQYKILECWKILSIDRHGVLSSPFFPLIWKPGNVACQINSVADRSGISVYLDRRTAIEKRSRFYQEVILPVYCWTENLTHVSEDFTTAIFSKCTLLEEDYDYILSYKNRNYVDFLFGHIEPPPSRGSEVQGMFFRQSG